MKPRPWTPTLRNLSISFAVRDGSKIRFVMAGPLKEDGPSGEVHVSEFNDLKDWPEFESCQSHNVANFARNLAEVLR